MRGSDSKDPPGPRPQLLTTTTEQFHRYRQPGSCHTPKNGTRPRLFSSRVTAGPQGWRPRPPFRARLLSCRDSICWMQKVQSRPGARPHTDRAARWPVPA
uniref:Uncharacterized protein n=2 Tax=unclassified Arthrobacter TaxID=235627 RepID=I3W183_9MICC|nr:hypothetical protein [Arthrobacter sp. J3.40]AFK89612.1 hypothetical protein [Arthrobacter sp. J3.53]